VIRTHDVAETRDAAVIGAEFARDRVRSTGEVAVEELDVTAPAEAERHLDRLGAADDVGAAAATYVFEFDGLDAAEAGALRAATVGTAAEVALGDPRGTRESTRRGLLVGSPAALSAVETDAAGMSSDLDRAFEVVSDAFS